MVEIVVPQAKEKWYQSRRIWGAILSLSATVAIVIVPEHYDLIIVLSTSIAGILGIYSWTAPKR